MEQCRGAMNKQIRILVLEDDTAQAELLNELFTDAGYEFMIKQAVDAIIPIVAEFNPDVILLDYLLGNVNGGEHCSAVKQHDQFKQIPVIMYSAYPRVMLSLGNYGCDLFIPKPFDIDDLLSHIEKLAMQKIKPTA